MQRFEGDGFAARGALGDARDGGLIEADIEVARLPADQFLAAVTQGLAGLPVDVHHRQVVSP